MCIKELFFGGGGTLTCFLHFFRRSSSVWWRAYPAHPRKTSRARFSQTDIFICIYLFIYVSIGLTLTPKPSRTLKPQLVSFILFFRRFSSIWWRVCPARPRKTSRARYSQTAVFICMYMHFILGGGALTCFLPFYFRRFFSGWWRVCPARPRRTLPARYSQTASRCRTNLSLWHSIRRCRWRTQQRANICARYPTPSSHRYPYAYICTVYIVMHVCIYIHIYVYILYVYVCIAAAVGKLYDGPTFARAFRHVFHAGIYLHIWG